MQVEEDPVDALNTVLPEVAMDDVEVKESETEPVAKPSSNAVAEPEESPVIVEPEPTAQELEAQRQREEAQRLREEEEKEREAERVREEQRLQGLVRKYGAIADRVGKYKSFRYKNGKLRVKVLRATNVDKKDMGLLHCHFSNSLIWSISEEISNGFMIWKMVHFAASKLH